LRRERWERIENWDWEWMRIIKRRSKYLRKIFRKDLFAVAPPHSLSGYSC
jgi:hypothetical protein